MVHRKGSNIIGFKQKTVSGASNIVTYANPHIFHIWRSLCFRGRLKMLWQAWCSLWAANCPPLPQANTLNYT